MLTNIALKLNLSACNLAPTGLSIPAFPEYRSYLSFYFINFIINRFLHFDSNVALTGWASSNHIIIFFITFLTYFNDRLSFIFYYHELPSIYWTKNCMIIYFPLFHKNTPTYIKFRKYIESIVTNWL